MHTIAFEKIRKERYVSSGQIGHFYIAEFSVDGVRYEHSYGCNQDMKSAKWNWKNVTLPDLIANGVRKESAIRPVKDAN